MKHCAKQHTHHYGLEQCGGARVKAITIMGQQFKHKESMNWDMKGAVETRQDMRIT
jgi:hypothetical protein